VPLTFITLMAVGGVLGISGVPVPFVELGIAFSIIVLGLAVAVQREGSVAAAMTLVSVFAIFHGHAHGTEMPVDAVGAEYAVGFVIATGLLHLIGIGIGLGVARAGTIANGRRITQVGGGVIAVLGVAVLMGIV
jgi:urease accessory protein